MLQIRHVVSERVSQACGRFHLGCEVFRPDVRRYVSRFKTRMNSPLGCVSIGIGADPAVVLDAGVKRLGSVSDIVPQPSSIEDDRLFHGGCGLMSGQMLAVLAKCGLQAAVDPYGGVGLQPDVLGKIVIGAVGGCCALFIELAVELVAAWRNWIEP